jgi:hypothetical protein
MLVEANETIRSGGSWKGFSKLAVLVGRGVLQLFWLAPEGFLLLRRLSGVEGK